MHHQTGGLFFAPDSRLQTLCDLDKVAARWLCVCVCGCGWVRSFVYVRARVRVCLCLFVPILRFGIAYVSFMLWLPPEARGINSRFPDLWVPRWRVQAGAVWQLY